MSYFVGANAVDNGIAGTGGFAINGGKGWKSLHTNYKITVTRRRARDGHVRLHVRDDGRRLDGRVHLRLQALRRRQGSIFLHHSPCRQRCAEQRFVR